MTMTREESIMVLTENRPTIIFEDEETQKRMADLCQAIDIAIEALSVDDEWIPVSERLPIENGEYIVSLEDSVYPWARFFNGKWFMLPFNAIAREFGEYEVLAWMPLPEPYREDGE